MDCLIKRSIIKKDKVDIFVFNMKTKTMEKSGKKVNKKK